MLAENPHSTKPNCEVIALAKSISDLERQLKELSKAAQPDERVIKPVRQSLRDNYEKILLLDHKYAMESQVEQNLWKSVFYKKIEDYRKRHSKMSAAVLEEDKKDRANEALRSLNASFSKFLEDSKKFYVNLLQKLLNICGIDLPGYSSAGNVKSVGLQAERREAMIGSCHRCLIYLGDLERYAQLYVEGGRSDWTAPEKHYVAASLLMPHVGNPYNQKAVLATYRADDIAGVYCYARALMCASPFLTARENLSLLFEKNRQKCEDPRRWEQALSAAKKGSDAKHKRRMEFLTRFVRLQGIIWTKVDLDDFKKIESSVLAELVSLLDLGELDGMPLVMMAAICIFMVCSAERDHAECGGSENTRIEMSLELALTFTFKFFCKVAVSARARDSQLSSLCILSDWLICNLPLLIPLGSDNHIVKKELRTARQGLIENVVDLLNLSSKEPKDKLQFRPLAEDVELFGFTPLSGSHQTIQRMTANGTLVDLKRLSESLDSKTAKRLRIEKLESFAQKLAAGPRPLLFYDSQNGEYSVEGNGIFNLANAQNEADGAQSQQRGKLMTPQLCWSDVVTKGPVMQGELLASKSISVDRSGHVGDEQLLGGNDAEEDNNNDETFGEAIPVGVSVPDDFSVWAQEAAKFASMHDVVNPSEYAADGQRPEEAEEVSDNYLELLVRKAIGSVVGEDGENGIEEPAVKCGSLALDMESEDQEEIILFRPNRKSEFDLMQCGDISNAGMAASVPDARTGNTFPVNSINRDYAYFSPSVARNPSPFVGNLGTNLAASNGDRMVDDGLGIGGAHSVANQQNSMWGGFNYRPVSYPVLADQRGPGPSTPGLSTAFDWNAKQQSHALEEDMFSRDLPFNPVETFADKSRQHSRFATKNPFAS